MNQITKRVTRAHVWAAIVALWASALPTFMASCLAPVVEEPPLGLLVVSPASATAEPGGTVWLTATPFDHNGNPASGYPVSWSSSNARIATVDPSGLVTGVGPGQAVIAATSQGRRAESRVNVIGRQPGQVLYYRTNFSDGTTGPLDVYAYGGGRCDKTAAYHDPGSAYSMSCSIPGVSLGAAALQAWFGNGRLSHLPLDPSLDQDVFQEVRFVIGKGATAAIGGTACTALNATSQFKMHKSVYGRVGSAWNGWVMSSIGPCPDGDGRLFSEAELWNVNGDRYLWPGRLKEGVVYDVIYRYHRNTAGNCGTIAVWVNGMAVLDSPCWAYMGATVGSPEGLLFWDGAPYLQSALGPLTIYTLFTQATNYPIGAASASP